MVVSVLLVTVADSRLLLDRHTVLLSELFLPSYGKSNLVVSWLGLLLNGQCGGGSLGGLLVVGGSISRPSGWLRFFL